MVVVDNVLVAPNTAPDVLTVAIVLDALLHAPPVPVVANEILALKHTLSAPVIVPALGNAFTVTG